MHDVTLWDHLLAVFAGVVLPLGGARQANAALPEEFTTREKVLTYWANAGLLVLLAVLTLLAWRAGERAPAELGLRAPRETGAGLALAAIFVVLWLADTLVQIGPKRLEETRRRWRTRTPFLPSTPREVAASLVLVAAAAVCEEIVFRGFLVAYVAHFTGTTPLGLAAAVALPSVVFGLCHAYQGGQAILKVVLLSAFFGALFVVTGSLWIPIALHFVVDLVGVMLGARLLSE